ncbi:MAG: tetratricopeptide repeat protein [Planctomycetota bacterium]
MIHNSIRRAPPLLFLALALILTPVFAGDRDVADLLCEKGEKAAKSRDYEGAIKYFQRALEEHSPHPEACFGLAKALEKLGRTGEAVQAYLRCLDELKGVKELSRAQKRMEGQARRAVNKLGKGYQQLSKLDAKFVEDLVAFGRKNFNGSPEWSKKAFQTALLLDPGNKLAKSYLERLRGVRTPAEAAGLFEAMILDDKLENWNPGIKKPWNCQGGVLSIDVKKSANNVIKTQLEHRYSVRATFRHTGEDYGRRTFGLLIGETEDTAWALLFSWADTVDLVKFDSSGSDRIQSKVLDNHKVSDWATLRVAVDGNEITTFLNGKMLFRHVAEKDTAFDGAPGVMIERCSAEVRDFEVQR